MKQFVFSPPLRTAFSVRTNDEHLARQLKIQYGGDFWQGSTSFPCKSVSFLREDGGYLVTYEGESWLTENPLGELDRLLFHHTEYDPSVLALHGAAVAWQGRAYLFLAHTMTGKTTLSAYLAACGFGYITDDCILLDRKNFLVYPCQKPIHLRHGGLCVLRELGITPSCETVYAPPNERYVYTPSSVMKEPVPLGEIFFIDRTEAENGVEAIPKTQRLERLLHSPITPYPVSGDYLRLLVRLADYGCRILHYSDMSFVRDTLKKSAL